MLFGPFADGETVAAIARETRMGVHLSVEAQACAPSCGGYRTKPHPDHESG